MVREALRNAGPGIAWKDLSAVAATSGPGLAGALLVGLTYAKAISFAAGIPLIAVHHIEGHIQAVMLEARQRGNPVELPALALVASGGHTHLYEVRETGYKLLGKTRDDAAGEAFDKVGKLLGFGYPGGPVIDRLAPHGNPRAVAFSHARMKGNTLDFSFSGLKTAVLRWTESHDLTTELEARRQLLRQDPQPSTDAWLAVTPKATLDLLASFQQTVIDELLGHAASAASQMEDVRSLIITGGVACNAGLRLAAGSQWAGLPVYFPTPALSTDNAVMIAAAAWAKYGRGEFAPLTEMAHPNIPLA